MKRQLTPSRPPRFPPQTLALLAKELEQAHRPHHVVGLIRVLDAMVKNLSVESALSMFWVGLGVTKIGSLYFSVGVRLVASALTTLLQGRTSPSPAGLCAFLELPRCAFMVDHLEDDWGVRFGGDGSFALGLLAMVSSSSAQRARARTSMADFVLCPSRAGPQLFKGLL